MAIKVFVYGSLKQNFRNHRVMAEASRGKFIGTGSLSSAAGFEMLDLEFYPALRTVSEDRTPVEIHGELFEVTTLKHLDFLEGYPVYYTRTRVQVTLVDGTHCLAWVYYLASGPNSVSGSRLENYPIVPTGNWQERVSPCRS